MPSSSEQSRKKDKSPGRAVQDDKNDESLTCLYVGNIDKKVDSNQLTDVFRKYGDLEYCYLVYEPTSTDRNSKEVKVSRGYGFVKFVKFQDLNKAKTQLDGYQINGRKIKVQISKRNKPRESTPGRYLGKKRNSPGREPRHRGRSYSRSSSGSYYERRRHHHQRKEKHRKRHDRSRDQYERSRSKDRSGEYRHRKRSYSNQRQRRRDRDRDRQ